MTNKLKKEIEFNLSNESIDTFKNLDGVNVKNVYLGCDVKEFIKKILTPNNISKGFVEVSTIKYYAGDKLIDKQENKNNETT